MAKLQEFRDLEIRKAIEGLDFEGKSVVIRVDYNCPVSAGRVTNNFRIKQSLPTLNLIKDGGAKKIVLITHFDRPDGKFNSEMSLGPVKDELEKIWGEKVVLPEYQEDYRKYFRDIEEGTEKVYLAENIRFWKEEEAGDSAFAFVMSDGHDFFINEAFSASHRKHASVTGISSYIPSFAGLELADECREIWKKMTIMVSPSVALIGGAKIETKVPVLKTLGKYYDRIMLGGKIALEYEKYASENPEADVWMSKVQLPQGYSDDNKFDISEEAALEFVEIVKDAKKILWNGPVGKFEDEKYAVGSEIVARAVSQNQEASRLVGGGDTIALLEKNDLLDKVGFVSTGGGAMLEYIGDGTLPGLEVIEF